MKKIKLVLFLLLIMVFVVIFVVIVRSNWEKTPAAVALSQGDIGNKVSQKNSVIHMDCNENVRCVEVQVKDDEVLPVQPDVPLNFRGYADPSITKDNDSDDLYMTYTYIPERALLETHLAKSVDGGVTWQFIKSLNSPGTFTTNGNTYNTVSEVSEIISTKSGRWYTIWVEYAHNAGTDRPASTRLILSSANAPEELGRNNKISLGGNWMSQRFSPSVNLSSLRGAQNCGVWTEPALFEENGYLYLFVECVHNQYSVFKTLSGPVADRLDWEFVGTFDQIAKDINPFAESLTQVDIANNVYGETIMIATPMRRVGNNNVHLGCYALELQDIDPPTFKKDTDGNFIVSSIITDSAASAMGPGACGYEAASKAGVMFVTRDFNIQNKDILFTLNATGIQP